MSEYPRVWSRAVLTILSIWQDIHGIGHDIVLQEAQLLLSRHISLALDEAAPNLKVRIPLSPHFMLA